MVETEALHKEIINTLANTFINRERFINKQALFMLCFQNESTNKCYNPIVCIGVSPPQPPLSFAKHPPFLRSIKLPKPPFLGNPPLYWFYTTTPYDLDFSVNPHIEIFILNPIPSFN